MAPESVLLHTANMWKGHIVAQFHGLIPPKGKIFSDLNPAWGKFGDIVIRIVSEFSCLILIPCVATREWVLQIGYWKAGNCAFNVYPWTQDGSLELQDLSSAPTCAILKNVPPQMYSLDGISVITSAIGEPLHTEKSRLDPFHFGDTKVKVEISLDSSPPETIIVQDHQGNSVRVQVSYPRLPPKCCNCDRFGHLLNRCPKPLLKRPPRKAKSGPLKAGGTVFANTKISLAGDMASSKAVLVDGFTPPTAAEASLAVEASVLVTPAVSSSDGITRPKSRSRSMGRARRSRATSSPHTAVFSQVLKVSSPVQDVPCGVVDGSSSLQIDLINSPAPELRKAVTSVAGSKAPVHGDAKRRGKNKALIVGATVGSFSKQQLLNATVKNRSRQVSASQVFVPTSVSKESIVSDQDQSLLVSTQGVPSGSHNTNL